jgi:DNA replication factor GINS
MGLDDLRNILLSERETGKLVSIVPDIFDRTHTEIAALLVKVYAIEDPLSEEARTLIEETMAVRETMQDLFSIRSRKILALTIMHAEGNYYDREEVKRMIPAEHEMFDRITAAIEACQEVLLNNARQPIIPATTVSISEGNDAVHEEDFGGEELPEPLSAPSTSQPSLSPPYMLVRVLEDMESFMGVDGRIYTLLKGDIVTLPERNAAVLNDRNIVLNMNLCK